MSVYDFISLCTETGFTLNIYDLNSNEVVWSGSGADGRWCDFADYEVLSFDVPEKPWEITVNIEVEDCEE